ncbi:MAG: DUF2892 domain-containing protein [Spirochaetia bacterium]|nr:DUF2892 domain-containing protein [Spirochaetia bacterium]
MGSADRIIRLLVAISIGVLYLSKVISGPVAIVLAVLAVIFTITAMVGSCPLYMLFRFSTIGKKSSQ